MSVLIWFNNLFFNKIEAKVPLKIVPMFNIAVQFCTIAQNWTVVFKSTCYLINWVPLKSLLQVFEKTSRCETGSEFINSGCRMVKRPPNLAAFWKYIVLSYKFKFFSVHLGLNKSKILNFNSEICVIRLLFTEDTLSKFLISIAWFMPFKQ